MESALSCHISAIYRLQATYPQGPKGPILIIIFSLLVFPEAWPPVFHDAHISLGTNLIKSQDSEEAILLIFVRGILVMEDGEVSKTERPEQKSVHVRTT